MPTSVTESRLLQVRDIELSELSTEFLNYDTLTESGEKYPLPKTGEYLLLFLYDENACELWTTIRRSTPDKRKYYKSLTGQLLKIKWVE